MGCCFSSTANPYPNEASASARAFRSSVLPASTETSSQINSSQTPSHGRRRGDQRPLHQHINQPLKRCTWTTTSRTWTRNQLDRERREFFETRVTGRPEAWQIIHAALQILWGEEGQYGAEGTVSVEGEDGNLATAQSIIDAGEISVPTGNLIDGVYDTLGNYYQLPAWVVSDPEDMTLDEQQVDEVGERRTEGAETGKEKGKLVLDDTKQFILKARSSETGKDTKLSIEKNELVGSIAHRLMQKSLDELELDSKVIRIAYMGRILKPHQTLAGQGWQEDHIVNAMVFPASAENPRTK